METNKFREVISSREISWSFPGYRWKFESFFELSYLDFKKKYNVRIFACNPCVLPLC
jgi:hypothetical protein